MSEDNPIRVYVTHTFSESDDYLRLFEYIESNPNFFYVNTSKPEELPSGGSEAFKAALREQIEAAETVVVLGSLFEKKRDWIQYQIDAAQALGRPIIAMKPFGGVLPMPAEVSQAAREEPEWNEREIVDALKRAARNEDTNRWEVIDFP
ncbi:TIR domain-containing protein [Lentisalinibacter sediminis]|uniref:TIR domain-containing protein n=1 Tax=Lentisalinibacter sediminis TaxID=2992237 RepID=UPI003862E652